MLQVKEPNEVFSANRMKRISQHENKLASVIDKTHEYVIVYADVESETSAFLFLPYGKGSKPIFDESEYVEAKTFDELLIYLNKKQYDIHKVFFRNSFK